MKTERPDVPSAEEEARRAGYRDDCRACIRAVALSGAEACSRHYTPTRERLPRDPGPDGGRAA